MAKVTRWLVIGGGTAGCVVASRLSEDTTNHVVLLEAGPDHGPGKVADRGGAFVADPARLQPGLEVVRHPGGTPVPYPQGFGLGGTSLISGAVSTPDPRMFAQPHLLPLEPADRLGTLGAAVVAADRRARPVLLARRDGQRVSVADAYLRPVLHRTNLMVVTNSPVVKLVTKGWSVRLAIAADGIEYAADRFVVCAGAVGTPALLLRSGLDTPGIGQNLQDHPACAITVELEPGADVDAPSIAVVLDRPGAQVLPLNHLPQSPRHGALLAGLMSVSSVGRVSLPTLDGPPLVELDQLSTKADVAGLTRIVDGALKLLESDPVRAVVRNAFLDADGTPASTIAGDTERIRAWVVDHVTGFHHLSSTCAEGMVTNPMGGVLGYDGLFVCDASLFPKVPLRNPYLPVVQTAERLSSLWRSSSR
jgi:choline dehydrogenase-like flavoprotein